EEAWQDLVQWLWPYLVAVAANALGHRDSTLDPEEIVQDVLIALARRWPSLHLDTSSALRHYAAGMVHNRVIDVVRHLYGRSQLGPRLQPHGLPPDKLAQISSPAPSEPAAEVL